MSIEKESFNIEKEKLNETIEWIEEKITSLKEREEHISNKINEINKEAKGAYNYEVESLQNSLHINKKNLNSYKSSVSAPYFARIDFREKLKDNESFYIGKVGLLDEEDKEDMVVDWRSPIADLYYSGVQGKASYKAPIGNIEGELLLKRKFIIKNQKLIDAFDEGINEIILNFNEENEGNGENALIDEFLKINLEENRGNKLKDIVSTIQKEQNDIIRADMYKPLIIQGSAGSGKTTIALHRIAYLLYKYKNKITGEDIVILAPNKLFLDYISEVLPNLGVDKVKQSTFNKLSKEILNFNYQIIDKDEKLSKIIENRNSKENKFITNTSKIKGSLVYKKMLDRYIKYLELNDMFIDDIKIQGYVLFPSREIIRLYKNDLKHLPLNKRKIEIKRYLNNKIDAKIQNVWNDIDKEYILKIREVKSKYKEDKEEEKRNNVIKLYEERDKKKQEIKLEAEEVLNETIKEWFIDDIVYVYRDMYMEEENLNYATTGIIPETLVNYMKNKIEEDANKEKIDEEDLAALLYLKINIDGVDNYKFSHMVIDEAQDYSPLELYVLKLLSKARGYTIVGDLGQSIYYYKGIDNWEKLIKEVYEEGEYTPLKQSYRSTVEIVDFANKVLRKQKNNLQPAKAVLRHGKYPEKIRYQDEKDFYEKLNSVIETIEKKEDKTIAIICKDYEQCESLKEFLHLKEEKQWEIVDKDNEILPKRIIIPSYITKGLEFDCSIIYDCSEENYSETELDKKILYVVLTRALHEEYIFYKGKITKLLI
ncbi:RNA polymerase recycling motor HelD [Clostridium sporogenes]|uniref:AAA family ATPase n=1 Tax=Clostridium sporogenes TaxID=1509 RepID=A0ABX4K4S7_CLOSG|nr:RNA polymerase recycling motor HelD [Clostridium sporogenes]NFF63671.1 AAA family ATPase [Clostridium sporogenes]NFH48584.1 AAA family ATPase [Clostridium sporogenes]NFQ68214.1 AAA family ATPase [Clostridium sporogenes]PHG99274.1 AAA family ATPase [Clostridium sporogenes]UBI10314.1 AAA family ATPase [Clostridium sporogenes]